MDVAGKRIRLPNFRWDRGWLSMKLLRLGGEEATLLSSVLLFVKENVFWRGIVSDAFLALSLEDCQKMISCIKSYISYTNIYIYIYLRAKGELLHTYT